MENLLEVSDDRKKQSKQKFWKAQIEIVIGAFLYTVPYNLIITPMGLYNGYMTGIAQIIKTILVRLLGIPVLFDWTGIILLGLNIPLFLMAYRSIGKRFFLETVFTVLLQTIFFSVIPVRAAPLIQDKLTACLVAGCISGTGVGIILRSGSSGGGIDIIGMYMLKKKSQFRRRKSFYGCSLFCVFVLSDFFSDRDSGVFCNIYHCGSGYDR